MICGGAWHFGAASYRLMARREGCLAEASQVRSNPGARIVPTSKASADLL
jgi:hypothetical protein